eukprot:TRINITY_DN17769_c0_g1_i1.p1 TRINITY_DN17769_c0_g1~~TRINITY_DN17769_c0_g1_i1.p1  ORF type:complete len:263 (+),score=36.94 TRINITY_DN17769_c0_g1_i1:179-967(+)
MRKTMPKYRWFLCGHAGSGTALHVDPKGTAAWNALLAGTKRWWFFPPSREQAFQVAAGVACRSPLQWWREYVAKDGGKAMRELGMLEAVQRPGETVFVPQGWWHQVLNLEFTASFTQNFVLPHMVPVALAEWQRGWPQIAGVYETSLLRRKANDNDGTSCLQEAVPADKPGESRGAGVEATVASCLTGNMSKAIEPTLQLSWESSLAALQPVTADSIQSDLAQCASRFNINGCCVILLYAVLGCLCLHRRHSHYLASMQNAL